ncbi:adult cuticle protein 1-like [Anoplophora glabripennis]|uniref:adult cuticle protein 1-like n=1 Tax=Anoplophora glabripennis TaxID=217634 RepID=UPI000874C1DA|nr:adult cuticle protein 1-like [Anoplophora glabripennis]
MKAIFVTIFALFAISYGGVVLPQAYSVGIAAPYGLPLAYSAPIVAPDVQSGYVAATRGAVHTAPLPQGPLAFSHHINTAPAPGTL